MTNTEQPAGFDIHAADYETNHQSSIAASGEPTVYFADYKVACLQRLGVKPTDRILDYGCGIGNLTERLVTQFSDVHGYDPSTKCLDIARRRAPTAVLHHDVASIANDSFQCAVISCVLHHVAPSARVELLERVRGKLAPGGRVVIFEHNPLNPVTRRAVAACVFDHDAILLWPAEARSLVVRAGFDSVKQDYVVFFPRSLSFLRRFEPRLAWFCLGAQTMTVGHKSPGS